MYEDRFGYRLTTTGDAARDAFVRGLDCILAVQAGAKGAFEEAVAADDGFALGHLGLARVLQSMARPAEAKAALARARDLAAGASDREASLVHALGLLIDGNWPAAYAAIRAHLAHYPRDAMAAQTCTGVYGLIGFSGQPGREAEQLAFTAWLMPHYEDDWWFLSQHAFALVEVGRVAQAEPLIDRSLEMNPGSPQSAHVRAHVHYEAGAHAAGAEALTDRRRQMSPTDPIHGHLSWHLALWALQEDDQDRVWALVDEAIQPDVAQAPPLFTLTDTASLLHRIDLAGGAVPAARWAAIADYATLHFPNTGIAFVDVHAALAQAMAGRDEALARIVSDAAGPAADVVQPLAEAFGAMAGGDLPAATAHLTKGLADHARIGGSRAQRDLLELTLGAVLVRQGKAEEARRLLALRRPVLADQAGLAA